MSVFDSLWFYNDSMMIVWTRKLRNILVCVCRIVSPSLQFDVNPRDHTMIPSVPRGPLVQHCFLGWMNSCLRRRANLTADSPHWNGLTNAPRTSTACHILVLVAVVLLVLLVVAPIFVFPRINQSHSNVISKDIQLINSRWPSQAAACLTFCIFSPRYRSQVWCCDVLQAA